MPTQVGVRAFAVLVTRMAWVPTCLGMTGYRRRYVIQFMVGIGICGRTGPSGPVFNPPPAFSATTRMATAMTSVVMPRVITSATIMEWGHGAWGVSPRQGGAICVHSRSFAVSLLALAGMRLPDSRIAETIFVCRTLYRHGPACPGHLSRQGAGGVGPDKPGHDGVEQNGRNSFPRFVHPVGYAPPTAGERSHLEPQMNADERKWFGVVSRILSLLSQQSHRVPEGVPGRSGDRILDLRGSVAPW